MSSNWISLACFIFQFEPVALLPLNLTPTASLRRHCSSHLRMTARLGISKSKAEGSTWGEANCSLVPVSEMSLTRQSKVMLLLTRIRQLAKEPRQATRISRDKHACELPMPHRFETGKRRTAQHYREEAVEMRERARRATTEKLRNLLLQNADLYDRMAELAERRKMISSR